MKYPQRQLEILKASISELAKHIDVLAMYPTNLHYLVYQQGSDGQKHNWLYISSCGIVCRQHTLTSLQGYKKLIDVPSNFELYPDGCNDDHVSTAVKYCLK